MEDIAKLAGVAKITVSRALRDSPLVRPELRDRVKAVAHKQGYRFNTTARNLRLQRTHSITAVIETEPGGDRPVGEPFVQMMIGGMLEELTQVRYQLVLTTRSMIEMSGGVDSEGIVLLGQGANDEATRRIREFGLPIAVWGVPPAKAGEAVFVCSDNQQGGKLVGNHLLALGRRNILYLGDISHSEVGERVRGLKTALGRKAKLTVAPCAFTQGAGQRAMAEAMRRSDGFDGVAAASDMIALGAIAALREAGKRIPEDVAVIGYDDIVHEAGLTSVRQDLTRGGATLAAKILQTANGHKATSELLPVELIVRASSGG
jgi:DNA-binding LacI/PurR family transcriptional regulator